MRVVLLEASNPCLVLVAVKTSQGKAWMRLDRYWPDCDEAKLVEWLFDAVDYPSVYEHLKLTWFVDGLSRVASHQLVRHRLASYTQESTRYQDYRIALTLECIVEKLADNIDTRDVLGDAEPLWRRVLERLLASRSLDNIVECLDHAFTRHVDPHTAITALHSYLEGQREYARYNLPMGLKTSVLVTMNLREFLHFYCLRTSGKASPEIRELAGKMLEEASKHYPWLPRLAEKYCKRWQYW